MKKTLKLFNHSGKICKRCTCGRKEQMESNKKSKVAFVKFAGLASGGTEKFLQTVAANLPKDKFEVDYYYTNPAPYVNSDFQHIGNDEVNAVYLKANNINLIPVNVGFKDVTKYDHEWLDTNFFELFNEDNYDLVVTARAGHSEYPYNRITKTPIVELITLPGMADHQANIVASVHISNFQLQSWINAGGNPAKATVIPLFSEVVEKTGANMRDELNIPNDAFVFGYHQREDDGIFSPIALEAYKNVMSEKTYFVIMGGSKNYQKFADANQLKNFIQLPFTADKQVLGKFLGTLNVFSHARKDGETFGLSIAEAMSFGIPAISHVAPAMGHVETIGNGGVVCKSLEEYVSWMNRLMNDQAFYNQVSENAKVHFSSNYSVSSCMSRFIEIFDKAMAEKAKDKLSDEDFWASI